MYNTDAYQFPLSRGIAESYVKYQMYTNSPNYAAQMGQYRYDDGGGMPTRNHMYGSTASTARESFYWYDPGFVAIKVVDLSSELGLWRFTTQM